MDNRPHQKPRDPGSKGLSRRELLVGAATAALVAGATSALGKAPGVLGKKNVQGSAQSPILRYMAASAVMGDGRILLTGGYTKPYKSGETPVPVNTAAIFNPWTGEVTPVTPMGIARARHAAVSLVDGRVAVIGGMSNSPTSSVEVYDPATNRWSNAKPLSQPRYDHTAATDGQTIFVMGGSSLNMLTGIETVYPG